MSFKFRSFNTLSIYIYYVRIKIINVNRIIIYYRFESLYCVRTLFCVCDFDSSSRYFEKIIRVLFNLSFDLAETSSQLTINRELVTQQLLFIVIRSTNTLRIYQVEYVN